MHEKKEKFAELLKESHEHQELHDKWDWMQFHKDPDGAISDMEKVLYGHHLCERTLKLALSALGKHKTLYPALTIEELEETLEENKINIEDEQFNIYDVSFVTQMKKSFYHKELNLEDADYVKMAIIELEHDHEYATKHALEFGADI